VIWRRRIDVDLSKHQSAPAPGAIAPRQALKQILNSPPSLSFHPPFLDQALPLRVERKD
jgi:hypothetical protein